MGTRWEARMDILQLVRLVGALIAHSLNDHLQEVDDEKRRARQHYDAHQ
jgi:hypothetical protein